MLEDHVLTIATSLDGRKLPTEEPKVKIERAAMMSTSEDIYVPLRPKKRTNATLARRHGINPLANFLAALAQRKKN